MDEKTFHQLESVFSASPSNQLAKVLIDYLLTQNKVDQLEPYLGLLDGQLEAEELSELIARLVEAEQEQGLATLLLGLGLEDARKVFDYLIEQNLLAQGKRLYRQYKETQPGISSIEYERYFDASEPAKLKVVERPLEAVTELSSYRQKTTDFNDVVGLTEIKKQIHKKIILPFKQPSLFSRFKKKAGGGVLLYGPPGCGKTLLARACAGECKATFFNVEISDVLDMYIGESESKLHAIFDKARAESPCVIFFDELEALAGKRENARNSATNIVSQFLTELDGFADNNNGVLVLASTNVPWSIDSAFLRPGRFDRMFFVPPPDQEARKAILQHHLQGRPVVGKLEFESLAQKTSGYSGADLANLVEMAADEAIDESIEAGEEKPIRQDHLRTAFSASRSTTIEWLTTARNYARYANDGGRYDDVMAFLKKHGKN